MTTPQWGYERADCRGSYALSLFLDDMERLIDHYTDQALKTGHADTVLFQAQAAANKLLDAYDKNARNTAAFNHQSIQIKSAHDSAGKLLLVPIFSAGLRQHLVKLLERSKNTHVH
jgi:hypothetical protein